MELPQIRISSKNVEVGIQTTPATIERTNAKTELQMKADQISPKIIRQPLQIQIDSTAARESLGQLSVARSVEQFAKDGYDAWLDAMYSYGSEGDQMMQIESGRDAIIDIASEVALPTPKDSQLVFLPPIGSVKIEWSGGQFEQQWNKKEGFIETKLRPSTFDYYAGRVQYYTKQQAQLDISFTVGNTIDAKK